MSTQGITLAPSYKVRWPGPGYPFATEINGSLDPTHLRKCALYWDMIDCPYINGFGSNHDRDVEYLLQNGALLRSTVSASDGVVEVGTNDESRLGGIQLTSHPYKGAIDHVAGLLGLAEAHSHEGVAWSTDLTDLDGVIDFLAFNGPPTAAREALAEVRLHDALPSAGPEVPIERILTFKRKRWEELNRLRIAMNQLFERVSQSEDPMDAALRTKREIEQALSDLHQAMHEDIKERVLTSVKGLVRSPATTLIGAIAGAGATAVPIPILGDLPAGLMAAVGAAAPAIDAFFKASPSLENLASPARAFAYAYRVNREFGPRP